MISFKKSLPFLLCIPFALFAEDITLRESTQAIINYNAYEKAKENAAMAQDQFAPAPQLEQTLKAPIQAQAQSLYSKSLSQELLLSTLDRILFQTSKGGSEDTPSHLLGLPNPIAIHYAKYCSNNETQKHPTYCVSSNFPQGDMDAANLMQPKTLSDAAARTAAQDYIGQITHPAFYELLSSGTPEIPLHEYSPNEIAKLSQRLQETAQGAMSAYSLSRILANRYPLSEQQSQTLPDGVDPKLSMMEFLSSESSRRFYDSSWAEALQKSPETAVLRELAHIEALRLHLEFLRLEQSERIEALLAVIVQQNIALMNKAVEKDDRDEELQPVIYQPTDQQP